MAKPKSYRMDEETLKMIEELKVIFAEKIGVTISDAAILKSAVQYLYKAETENKS